MPDRRCHRGKNPDDDRLFAEANLGTLRTAVAECSWLLTRGYAVDSALKLVGDHHGLTARQRMAVRRSSCSDRSLEHRAATMTPSTQIAGRPVGVDGYNLLITVESSLSGGLILVGRDGCPRDLASVHGTYRKVDETIPAVELIVDFMRKMSVSHVDWYLDRPVSNSGRLKSSMAGVLAAREGETTLGRRWNIELVDSPDAVLASYPHHVASSDSVLLDRCTSWVNLAAEIIETRIPTAWKVDLRSAPD